VFYKDYRHDGANVCPFKHDSERTVAINQRPNMGLGGITQKHKTLLLRTRKNGEIPLAKMQPAGRYRIDKCSPREA
jgi:hypothetical protein